MTKARFKKIRLLVCDFDGVFTDNTVRIDENGNESVICNRSDGLGIEMLKKAGIDVIVISKEKNPIISARCKKLGIKSHRGIENKINIFKKEVAKRNLPISQVCFMGNDINDLECIKAAGIGVGVADSHAKVLKVANYITTKHGGNGAIREICDLILN